MISVKKIFDDAFSRPRNPRSPEYKLGVLEALKFRLGEITEMKCPYRIGTYSTMRGFREPKKVI